MHHLDLPCQLNPPAKLEKVKRCQKTNPPLSQDKHYNPIFLPYRRPRPHLHRGYRPAPCLPHLRQGRALCTRTFQFAILPPPTSSSNGRKVRRRTRQTLGPQCLPPPH